LAASDLLRAQDGHHPKRFLHDQRLTLDETDLPISSSTRRLASNCATFNHVNGFVIRSNIAKLLRAGLGNRRPGAGQQAKRAAPDERFCQAGMA
jgi:hypothetical protein